MKYLIFLLLPLLSFSQGISLNISQDTRLAFAGDDKGNEAFTANYNIGVELRGVQSAYHYFLMRPEYEFADLQGGDFNRMSSSFGVTFNTWVKHLDFTATIGGGMIWRNGLSGLHAVSNFQMTWKFTDMLGLFIDSELLQRSDLGYDVIMYSGKIGIKIILK